MNKKEKLTDEDFVFMERIQNEREKEKEINKKIERVEIYYRNKLIEQERSHRREINIIHKENKTNRNFALIVLFVSITILVLCGSSF